LQKNKKPFYANGRKKGVKKLSCSYDLHSKETEDRFTNDIDTTASLIVNNIQDLIRDEDREGENFTSELNSIFSKIENRRIIIRYFRSINIRSAEFYRLAMPKYEEQRIKAIGERISSYYPPLYTGPYTEKQNKYIKSLLQKPMIEWMLDDMTKNTKMLDQKYENLCFTDWEFLKYNGHMSLVLQDFISTFYYSDQTEPNDVRKFVYFPLFKDLLLRIPRVPINKMNKFKTIYYQDGEALEQIKKINAKFIERSQKEVYYKEEDDWILNQISKWKPRVD